MTHLSSDLIQLGNHKLLDGQLRSFEAYTKGRFHMIRLRLLCPCYKSSDVNLTAPAFPRIIGFLLPDTVNTVNIRLSEPQVFPLVYPSVI